MPTLLVKSGPLAGQQIDVTSEIVIGRQNADVTIDDAELSRRHVAVRPAGNGLEVEDLGSTNGTFVNDARISSPTPVSGGSRIKLGITLIEVEGVPAGAGETRMTASPVADSDRTQVREVPQVPADVTVPGRATPPPPSAVPPPPAPPSTPAAAPLAASAPAAQDPQAFGSFSPPAAKKGSGIYSRSWIPAVLSLGTFVVVLIALLIYFISQ